MSPSDIVLVRFPFSELDSTKKRPALVLSRVDVAPNISLVTLAMITSQMEGLSLKGDVRLSNWREASLLHPSLVRLSKIATLDFELIEKRLGKLVKEDAELVKKQFRRLFNFWI